MRRVGALVGRQLHRPVGPVRQGRQPGGEYGRAGTSCQKETPSPPFFLSHITRTGYIPTPLLLIYPPPPQCAFRLGNPHRREPVFDLRLATTVLLYDTAVHDYCEEHCFCPETEDQYLATDLRAARLRSGVSAGRQLPEAAPTAAARGRVGGGDGVGSVSGVGSVDEGGRVSGGGRVGSVGGGGRVEAVGRVRAYRGRGFQCMGVQGRGTSGMMSCYCRRAGARPPVRAVTFFLGG